MSVGLSRDAQDGGKKLELLNMFTASVGVERVRCRLESSQNTHASPLHFFVSKMEMPPCFGLAKREHLVECRDHTDQRKDCSSINQRLIGLGVIDLVVSQKSPSLYLKCNGASSRSETTSYNPSFTLSGRHHIPLGTITLPRK
jgi:hypothetical protein